MTGPGRKTPTPVLQRTPQRTAWGRELEEAWNRAPMIQSVATHIDFGELEQRVLARMITAADVRGEYPDAVVSEVHDALEVEFPVGVDPHEAMMKIFKKKMDP